MPLEIFCLLKLFSHSNVVLDCVSEVKLKALDLVAANIMVTDSDYNIIYMNPAVTHLLER